VTPTVLDCADRADQTFRQVFQAAAAGIWTAPGRVNLIGEHTDYNDGFALPYALAQTTAVAVRPSRDGRSRVWSEVYPGLIDITARRPRDGDACWYDYVAGILWTLERAGHDVPGVEIAIASDVPTGAGLSSSAALECSVLSALCDLGALDIPIADRPALAQRAENAYVGVPCGIMDQAASLLCRDGHALLIDARGMETTYVPLDATILVIDTRAPHRHADGEYARRRTSCHAAARTLGVPALRDATPDDLDRIPDDVVRRRARHVVTENQRVIDTVAALGSGDMAAVGCLMTASHVSMRDDFEITVPEVDLAVASALGAGATGARMTGGGFGGCVLALVEPDRVDAVADAVTGAFANAGFGPPAAFVSVPSAGARRVIPG
jgi:galactokinase